MKKLLLTLTIAVAGIVTTQAQTTTLPTDCSNSGTLQGTVNNCEAQGFILTNVSVVPINYLVQPDPPYISGTVTLTFEPDCAPLEPCPQILKIAVFNMVVKNNSGNCVYENAL